MYSLFEETDRQLGIFIIFHSFEILPGIFIFYQSQESNCFFACLKLLHACNSRGWDSEKPFSFQGYDRENIG